MSHPTCCCGLGSMDITPYNNNGLNLSDINDKSIFNDDGQYLYEKIKDIGAGTYGKVYLAKHVSTNKKLVIKQMKHFADEEGGLQPTMLREVSLLKI